MKKISCGFLFLNLFSLSISLAMQQDEGEISAKRRKLEEQPATSSVAAESSTTVLKNEEAAATLIQQNWRGYRARKEAANLWVEKITSNALRDILAGEFNLKSTFDRIMLAPHALHPFIIEKVMILIVKNIAFNVKIKERFSQEFLTDLYAVIEGLFEGYGHDHLLYALKKEFVNGHRNTELKKAIQVFSKNPKDLVERLVAEFKGISSRDPSGLLHISEILDKSVDELMGWTMENAELISNKCLSREFKVLLRKLVENHEQLTLLVKALIAESLSRALLSSERGTAPASVGSGCIAFA